MSAICFDEQGYKQLLPVPKTHLFMKKMAKIHALDRQMRRKWIKIKRNSEQQINLSITEKDNLSPVRNKSLENQISQKQLSYTPNMNPSFVTNLQNQLKRQNIIFNHRKHEEIFYRKRSKPRYIENLKQQKDKISVRKGFFSNSFDSSKKRRVKTEIIQKQKILQDNQNYQIQKPLHQSHDSSNKKSYRRQQNKIILSPSILRQRQCRIQQLSLKHKDMSIKLPNMLSRPQKRKQKQMQILQSKSQRQLFEINTKNKHNLNKWASNRVNLLNKLKGSKAYYIMRSPLTLQEHQNFYYC